MKPFTIDKSRDVIDKRNTACMENKVGHDGRDQNGNNLQVEEENKDRDSEIADASLNAKHNVNLFAHSPTTLGIVEGDGQSVYGRQESSHLQNTDASSMMMHDSNQKGST